MKRSFDRMEIQSESDNSDLFGANVTKTLCVGNFARMIILYRNESRQSEKLSIYARGLGLIETKVITRGSSDTTDTTIWRYNRNASAHRKLIIAIKRCGTVRREI